MELNGKLQFFGISYYSRIQWTLPEKKSAGNSSELPSMILGVSLL